MASNESLNRCCGLGQSRLVLASSLCLILGLILGYSGALVNYEPQIVDLQTTLSTTRNQLTTLETDYNALENDYDQLRTDHSSLVLSHSSLEAEHSSLMWNYSSLESRYADFASYYKGLSENVAGLYDLLCSYSSVPEVFRRTLNEDGLQKTGEAVFSATGGSTDRWSSYGRIYDYITSNVDYARDIDMLYPSTYRHVDFDGFDYITEFKVTTFRNYVKTPGLTLEIKQGDCDDQAVLAYAMVKYYMIHVAEAEYSLYIAFVEFSDGSAHLAVMLPVERDQLCIIDPAGRYLTSMWGSIASKEALSELQSYSNHWQPSLIENIELYDVAVTDGSYHLVAEGTIEEVAAVFG